MERQPCLDQPSHVVPLAARPPLCILCILLSAICPPCAQVWDHLTGRLKLDLPYQAQEQFMLHDSAVRCARCAARAAALAGWCCLDWLGCCCW